MARQRSALKSGIGNAARTLVRLVEAVEDLGGDDDDVRKIETDAALRQQIASLLVQDRMICGRYPLTVNRDMPLADMIAAGHYDWTNNDITADHFPIAGSGTVEIDLTLFHFNRDMSTKAVLEELDRHGFRPATIDELLALGAKHPDLQLEYHIVALASLWGNSLGGKDYPCLNRSRSDRDLHLHSVGFDWSAHCRFAAVQK